MASELLRAGLTRRAMLRGVVATGVGMTISLLDTNWSLQPTLVAAGAQTPVELGFSWWGEDEAPGLRGWVNETIQLFQQNNPNITINSIEQSVDGVEPSLKAAAAARSGPDIFYAWSAGYNLETIWSGAFAPLNELLPDDLSHIPERVKGWPSWDGQTYALPFYQVPFWNVYNKEHYAEAGLDPDHPPQTFDAWIEANKLIKEKGHIVFGLGVKDQWATDWIWLPWAQSNLTSQYEWFECWLGLNGKSMVGPEVGPCWETEAAIINNGFLRNDTKSMSLYEALDLFVQGQVANVTGVQPLIKSWSKKMGDKLGHYFSAPAWGTRGQINNDVCMECQWLSISDWSPHKQEAAMFLSFVHTPERIKALYDRASAVIPDDRFDPAWLETQWEKDLVHLTETGQRWTPTSTTLSNFSDFTVPNFSGLGAHQITAQDAAARAESVSSDFRKNQPELVERYKVWAENFRVPTA